MSPQRAKKRAQKNDTKANDTKTKPAITEKSKRQQRRDARADRKTLRLSRWQIIKNSWREFRDHIKLYVVAAGIVLIPSAIIRAYSSTQKGSSTDYSIALFLAGLFCVLALFWLAQRRSDARLRDLYVGSSRRILPFTLVAILVALCLLPSFFGVLMIILGISYAATIWLMVGGVLLNLLSIWLLARIGTALVAVVDERVGWRRSLAVAWRVSRHRFWYLFWSYFLYFLVIGALSALVIQLFGLIPSFGQNGYFTGIVSGIVLTFTVPWLVIYSNMIFENLGGWNEATTS